jgi:hypothetical protein
MASVPASEAYPQNQAVIRSMLRRRKSPAKLYWRLERPASRKYVRAVVDVLVCRTVAAAEICVAAILCAFIGAVASNAGYLRRADVRTLSAVDRGIGTAEAHAIAELTRWVPALMVLSLILVCIPRPHLWIFRLTFVLAVGFGYYYHHLPPFPRSTVATDVMARAESLSSLVLRQHSISPAAGYISLASAAIIAHILYRRSYTLTARTTHFIPRRPRSHNHSVFHSVSVNRRLAAVAVTSGLLLIDLWVARTARGLLIGVGYWLFPYGQGKTSLTDWFLVAFAVAAVICMPKPRGDRNLLIATLITTTFYALASPFHLPRMPRLILNTPGGFWLLIIIYIVSTGLGFEAVTALLEWPVYVSPVTKRRY